MVLILKELGEKLTNTFITYFGKEPTNQQILLFELHFVIEIWLMVTQFVMTTLVEWFNFSSYKRFQSKTKYII